MGNCKYCRSPHAMRGFGACFLTCFNCAVIPAKAGIHPKYKKLLKEEAKAPVIFN